MTWAALTAGNVKKEGGGQFKVDDFVPKRSSRRMAPADQLVLVEHLNAVFGGRDLRPQRVG